MSQAGPPGWVDARDPLVSADYNGWWQRSFGLLRATWKPMAAVFGVASLADLVLTIPATLRFEAAQRDARERIEAAGDQIDFTLFFVGVGEFAALTAGAGLVYVLATLVAARMVIDAALGRTAGSVAAAATAARRMPAMIGWSIPALLLAVVAFALCFLPVLYAGAVLMVLPIVVLVERGNAISRCFGLFHGDVGAALSRVATIAALSVAGLVVVNLITTVVLVASGSTLEDRPVPATVAEVVLQGVYTFAIGLVTTPMLVTAYADMRARREPFTSAALRSQE